MGRSRFVKPETVRLELTGGDWVLVKKRLTAGEHRTIFGRMVAKMTLGEKPELNPRQAGVSQMAEYLLDWSLLNADGTPCVIRDQPYDVVATALEQLELDDFNEIFQAINDHETRMNDARAEEKKLPISPNGSGAT